MRGCSPHNCTLDIIMRMHAQQLKVLANLKDGLTAFLVDSTSLQQLLSASQSMRLGSRFEYALLPLHADWHFSLFAPSLWTPLSQNTFHS